MGYLPTPAFQFCEALRTASSWGWYVFPPADISLVFDGHDIAYLVDGEYQPLRAAYLPEYIDFWNQAAPTEFKGLVPPYLRIIPSRGVVQVWSGWLVKSAPGWSVMIRSIANGRQTSRYFCYEGIVQTDVFAPCPLFMNLQLVATNVPIVFRRNEPLFQVQPVPMAAFSDLNQREALVDAFDAEGRTTELMTLEDWRAYRATFRADVPDESHRFGDYGADVRKRGKQSEA